MPTPTEVSELGGRQRAEGDPLGLHLHFPSEPLTRCWPPFFPRGFFAVGGVALFTGEDPSMRPESGLEKEELG